MNGTLSPEDIRKIAAALFVMQKKREAAEKAKATRKRNAEAARPSWIKKAACTVAATVTTGAVIAANATRSGIGSAFAWLGDKIKP